MYTSALPKTTPATTNDNYTTIHVYLKKSLRNNYDLNFQMYIFKWGDSSKEKPLERVGMKTKTQLSWLQSPAIQKLKPIRRLWS